MRQPTGGAPKRPLKLLQVVYFLYMTLVIIYSVFRYARRSLEREVSHARTILLAVGVGGALMLSFMIALDEYVWGLINAGQGIIWYPLIAVALSFLVAGLGRRWHTGRVKAICGSCTRAR